MTTTAPALIDILSLIQQHVNIQLSGRATNSKDGKEYHSNCPWCGGTDRFAIWPDTGRWSCKVRSSGCGRWGDAIGFLMQWEDMTYTQACFELDIDPRYPEESKNALPLFMTKDEAPNAKWMEAAEAFVWRAQRYLFSSGGERGLNYLHSRGFTDDTLKAARIGFVPDWFSESLEAWGLSPLQTDGNEEIKIPEGIILPWIVDAKIWKISVRRPDKSYYQVLGSSDCLYNIDSLQPNLPVFLFEGEFDALSAMQEAGHLAACIATGSASKGRTSPLVSRLKQVSHVLVAFDTDEAGHSGSQDWLKILKNAVRWQPWSHDANDMLQNKMPIRLWAEMGIKAASIELQAPEKPPQQASSLVVDHTTLAQKTPSKPVRERVQTYIELNPWTTKGDRGLPKFCSICKKAEAVYWGSGVTPFCEKCWSGKRR